MTIRTLRRRNVLKHPPTSSIGADTGSTGSLGAETRSTGSLGIATRSTSSLGAETRSTSSLGAETGSTDSLGAETGYTSSNGADTGSTGSLGADPGSTGSLGVDTGSAGSLVADTGSTGSLGATGATGSFGADIGSTGSLVADTGSMGPLGATGSACSFGADIGSTGSLVADTGSTGSLVADTGSTGSLGAESPPRGGEVSLNLVLSESGMFVYLQSIFKFKVSVTSDSDSSVEGLSLIEMKKKWQEAKDRMKSMRKCMKQVNDEASHHREQNQKLQDLVKPFKAQLEGFEKEKRALISQSEADKGEERLVLPPSMAVQDSLLPQAKDTQLEDLSLQEPVATPGQTEDNAQLPPLENIHLESLTSEDLGTAHFVFNIEVPFRQDFGLPLLVPETQTENISIPEVPENSSLCTMGDLSSSSPSLPSPLYSRANTSEEMLLVENEQENTLQNILDVLNESDHSIPSIIVSRPDSPSMEEVGVVLNRDLFTPPSSCPTSPPTAPTSPSNPALESGPPRPPPRASNLSAADKSVNTISGVAMGDDALAGCLTYRLG